MSDDTPHPPVRFKKRPGTLQEQQADADAREGDRKKKKRGQPVRVRGFKKGRRD